MGRSDATVKARLRKATGHAVRSAVAAGRRLTQPEPSEEEIADAPTIYPYLSHLQTTITRRRGAAVRAPYLFGVLHAAHLARTLGVPEISAVEFGVAGGNGLVALEATAAEAEAALGVRIQVHGFDTGQGLPAPVDVRDCPNLWTAGDYAMDVPKLRARLRRAELHLGLVRDTLPLYLSTPRPPLGFVSVDVDLYSSTVDALKVLVADEALLLPRIHCYFDDVLGFTYGPHNGELLAIEEFNRSGETRKMSKMNGLRFYLPASDAGAMWVEKMYMAHVLDHSLYGRPDGLTRPGAAAPDGALRLRD